MTGAVHEHEFEPVPGLPERLPTGEQILWQGSPDWRALAKRVFKLHWLTAYFTALVTWSGVQAAGDGVSAMLPAIVVPLTLSIGALGMLAALASLTARSAAYTITNRRIVMRIGIVLSITFNIPFRRIASADLKAFGDGSGDLALALARGEHIGYLHLWPHARPWRLARPEPALRSIPDAAGVASILAEAMNAADPGVAIAASTPLSSHDRRPSLATAP